MSVPTEEAERWAQTSDSCSLPSLAAAIRSLAAERDALQAKAFRVAVAYEALKAENEKLRAALSELVDIIEHALEIKSTKDMDSFTLQPARAALGEKE